MSAAKLAGRYAKSILELSKEKGQLEVVYQDMSYIKKLLNVRDFWLMTKSPIINTAKKRKIFKEVFGDKLNTITSSFIDIVVNKRREFHLPEIVNAFVEQYQNQNQIVTAKLVTAIPAGEEMLGEVRGIVLQDTGKKEVVLKTETDPSLIGGFILTFEDKLYDSSIAHKLDTLRKGFEKNKYIREY